MQSITFTCETITPMFLSGADTNEPELRAPSIKGALRFWWRAMNGHLGLEELKEREAQIFGDTKRRSKVIIQVVEDLKYDNISQTAMLPHKTGREASVTNCFPSNNKFKIKLSLYGPFEFIKKTKISNEIIEEKTNIFFNIEKLKNLFVISCVLGGLGKRSRRGFGSVNITHIKGNTTEEQEYSVPISVDDIITSIQIIEPNFTLTTEKIDYPIIKDIQVGNTTKTVLNIAQVTSHLHPERGYKTSLGAGSPRLASPIYVSILHNQIPIITTLACQSANNTLQTTFKNQIL